MSAQLLTARVASTAVNTGAAATTSASITPEIGEGLFVFALATSGAAFTDTTTVTGNGCTWTKVASVISGNDIGILYHGYVAAPTAGTVVITFSRTPTAGRYQILGVREGGGATSGVAASQTTNGTATNGTMTITTSGTGDRFVSFWAHKTAEATTEDTTGATWTEFSDVSTTYGMEVQNIQRWGEYTNTASWTTSSFYFAAMVQLKHYAEYTLANKTDTPKKMLQGPLAVMTDDEPVWAFV